MWIKASAHSNSRPFCPRMPRLSSLLPLDHGILGKLDFLCSSPQCWTELGTLLLILPKNILCMGNTGSLGGLIWTWLDNQFLSPTSLTQMKRLTHLFSQRGCFWGQSWSSPLVRSCSYSHCWSPRCLHCAHTTSTLRCLQHRTEILRHQRGKTSKIC